MHYENFYPWSCCFCPPPCCPPVCGNRPGHGCGRRIPRPPAPPSPPLIEPVSVTYNPHGGTGGDITVWVLPGQTIIVAANTSVNPGYTFVNWNTAPNGTGTSYNPGDAVVIGRSGFALYAMWAPISTALTYNANGGVGADVVVPAVPGEGIVVAANTFTRAGYTFAGWNTAANGTGTGYAPGSTITMGTSSITLYAMWTANTVTLTYNANGGVGADVVVPAVPGEGIVVAANTFTRAGYTFSGWNTAANGSGTSYAPGSTITMGTSSVTLYAMWTLLALTLTYDANGGLGADIVVPAVPGEGIIVAANTFTNPGSGFSNWNTAANGSGTNYSPGDTITMGASDVTLYAVWSIEPPFAARRA